MNDNEPRATPRSEAALMIMGMFGLVGGGIVMAFWVGALWPLLFTALGIVWMVTC